MRTSFSTIRFAADALSTVANATPAIVAPVAAPAPAFNAADTTKSNVAAPKRTPKLSGAAVKPTKQAKPTTEAKPAPVAKPADKPVAEMHGYTARYAGASQPLRAHNKRLSPIVLDRVPNAFTDRDGALLTALHTANGRKAFKRLNIDAGALSRLIGHGYVTPVSGMLDTRDATFALTAKAVTERFKTVAAPKA